ncbi:MAG TPA: hypothetical protein PKE12_04265 [Kiritimatiellia bacterium]|nr:hypothetical protein [Kiritimatiellia bacterium]
MKRAYKRSRVNGFPLFVLLLVVGLLAAPLPLHACLNADAGGCSCCCSHDGAAMSCCAGETEPAPEPSCCFTVDSDPGLMPSQHRDAAPILPLITTVGDMAPTAIRPHTPSFAAPSVGHAVSTTRRLSVLCSFLN